VRRLLTCIWRRPTAAAGLVVVALVTIAAVAAPWLSRHDPNQQDLTVRLRPPGPEHLLGTDAFGRDQLSRLLHGARVSLAVGLVAVAVAAGVGGSVGLLAGYRGGGVDTVLMRAIDVVMAFPTLLLAIAVLALLGGRVGPLASLMLAVAVASMPHFARLVRAQVLFVRELDFVEAARALGGGELRVMVRHVLLNSLTPLLVFATMRIATVILTEASLSFLGLGVPAPTATWGGMIADGTRFLQRAPWLSFAPGLAIMLTVLAFSFLGDGLRDAFDPQQARLIDAAERSR